MDEYHKTVQLTSVAAVACGDLLGHVLLPLRRPEEDGQRQHSCDACRCASREQKWLPVYPPLDRPLSRLALAVSPRRLVRNVNSQPRLRPAIGREPVPTERQLTVLVRESRESEDQREQQCENGNAHGVV